MSEALFGSACPQSWDLFINERRFLEVPEGRVCVQLASGLMAWDVSGVGKIDKKEKKRAESRVMEGDRLGPCLPDVGQETGWWRLRYTYVAPACMHAACISVGASFVFPIFCVQRSRFFLSCRIYARHSYILIQQLWKIG